MTRIAARFMLLVMSLSSRCTTAQSKSSSGGSPLVAAHRWSRPLTAKSCSWKSGLATALPKKVERLRVEFAAPPRSRGDRRPAWPQAPRNPKLRPADADADAAADGGEDANDDDDSDDDDSDDDDLTTDEYHGLK